MYILSIFRSELSIVSYVLYICLPFLCYSLFQKYISPSLLILLTSLHNHNLLFFFKVQFEFHLLLKEFIDLRVKSNHCLNFYSTLAFQEQSKQTESKRKERLQLRTETNEIKFLKIYEVKSFCFCFCFFLQKEKNC